MDFKSKVLFHNVVDGDFSVRSSTTRKNMVIAKYPKTELIIEEQNKYIVKEIDISMLNGSFIGRTTFSPDGQYLVFVYKDTNHFPYQYEIGIYHIQSENMTVKTFSEKDCQYRREQSFTCYDSFIRLYANSDTKLLLVDIDYRSLEKSIAETEIPLNLFFNDKYYRLAVLEASSVNQRFLIPYYEKEEQYAIFVYDCETKEMMPLDNRWESCIFSKDGQYLYGKGYRHIGVLSLADNKLNYIVGNDILPTNDLKHSVIPVDGRIFWIQNYIQEEYDPYVKHFKSLIFDYYQRSNKHYINHFINEIDFYRPKNVALFNGQNMCTYYNFASEKAIAREFHEYIRENKYVHSFFTANGNILIRVGNEVFILQIEQ
jgi:hypothetical protein